MRQLRVLIACEESQTACIEFRKLGHEAYSCSKSFPGIAKAMAEQWSQFILSEYEKSYYI